LRRIEIWRRVGLWGESSCRVGQEKGKNDASRRNREAVGQAGVEWLEVGSDNEEVFSSTSQDLLGPHVSRCCEKVSFGGEVGERTRRRKRS
jgi:hypothetical protein